MLRYFARWTWICRIALQHCVKLLMMILLLLKKNLSTILHQNEIILNRQRLSKNLKSSICARSADKKNMVRLLLAFYSVFIFYFYLADATTTPSAGASRAGVAPAADLDAVTTTLKTMAQSDVITEEFKRIRFLSVQVRSASSESRHMSNTVIEVETSNTTNDAELSGRKVPEKCVCPCCGEIKVLSQTFGPKINAIVVAAIRGKTSLLRIANRSRHLNAHCKTVQALMNINLKLSSIGARTLWYLNHQFYFI